MYRSWSKGCEGYLGCTGPGARDFRGTWGVNPPAPALSLSQPLLQALCPHTPFSKPCPSHTPKVPPAPVVSLEITPLAPLSLPHPMLKPFPVSHLLHCRGARDTGGAWGVHCLEQGMRGVAQVLEGTNNVRQSRPWSPPHQGCPTERGICPIVICVVGGAQDYQASLNG